MFHVKEKTLELADTKIDYVAFGKGRKPLIMIQGLNTRDIKGNGMMLAYMYRLFSREYRVYLFDRRKNVQEGITVRDMAMDVANAMDALKISNADVIGVSQGGMIAQYLAMDRPDLVRKMVLAVTLSRKNDQLVQAVNKWIDLTCREDMKTLVQDMAEKMYSDAYIKRYRPFMPLLALLQKPKNKERFIALTRACLTCDTYESLEKIKCPVFVIGGEQDKVTTGTASKEMAEKLGCEIYMYKGLGHAAYEEAKDFNQRMYDFLKK